MKFCEKCGNEIEEGNAFCEKCGTKVESKHKEEKHHEEKIKEEEVEVKPHHPVHHEPPKPPKSGKGKIVFLSILNVILLATTIVFLVLWLTKSSSSNSSNGNNSNNENGSENGKENGKNNGKGNGKVERTAEYLFDQYIKGYTKADLEAFEDAFPPFYIEYSNYTQDQLNSYLNRSKARYGSDFTIKYEFDSKTKVSSSELEEINDEMKSYYGAKEKASVCYEIKGSITFTGSLDEDTDPIEGMYYCNYSGTWYLIG